MKIEQLNGGISRYNPVNRQQVVNGGMSRINYGMTNPPAINGSSLSLNFGELTLNGVLTLNGELTLNGMHEVDDYCEECLMNDVIPTEIGFLNGKAERQARRSKRKGRRAKRKEDRQKKIAKRKSDKAQKIADRKQERADKKTLRYERGKGRRMQKREDRLQERKDRRMARQEEKKARREGRQQAFSKFGDSLADIGDKAISTFGEGENEGMFSSGVGEYISDFVDDNTDQWSDRAMPDDPTGDFTSKKGSVGSGKWFKSNAPWSYVGVGVAGLIVVDLATGGKIRESIGMKKKKR